MTLIEQASKEDLYIDYKNEDSPKLKVLNEIKEKPEHFYSI